MSLLNGVALGEPLHGWVIARGGNGYLIGKPAGDWLDPVYELQAGVSPQGIGWRCIPILALASIHRIRYRPDDVIEICDALHREERKALGAAVKQAEELCGQIRALHTGIVMAPTGSVATKR